MRAPKTHVPGPAPEGDPPPALLRLAESFAHPLVKSSGISCTRDGRWALYLSVVKTASVPLADAEAMAASCGFAVVYEAAPDTPARAYRR